MGHARCLRGSRCPPLRHPHRIITTEPSLAGLPDTLLPLVSEALRKEPEQRPNAADLAERVAALHGPDGAAVFPTLAYTRVQNHATETSETIVLDGSQWDIPLPPEDEPAAPEADGAQPTPPPIPPPSAPPQPTAVPLPPPDISVLPTQSAPNASVQKQSVPPQPVPTWPPRRRTIHTLFAAIAATGIIAAGAWGGWAFRTDTQSSASPAKNTAGPATSGSEPSIPSPAASSTSDEEPTPTSEPDPEPEVVTMFGGLEVTVPATSAGTFSHYTGPVDEDGYDGFTDEAATKETATEVDFTVPGEADTGLRILYFPDLTTDEIRRAADQDEPSVFNDMWSFPGDDSMSEDRLETVLSAKEGPLTDIGSKKALSWTMHTDVLPDYDGARKNSHRVWWLPYSKYLFYTYGKHDKESDRQVDRLLKGVRFRATEMPRDCAGAIVALDKSAASGDSVDDHGTLVNCLPTATDGAEQLDPGTVNTRTEAACVALAHAYRHYGANVTMTDEAAAYKELRPWCDLPGAVRNPVVPDHW